ncbi:hypothetical protein F5878DRAFT_648146, partial [Lentinula raphanica]
MPRYFASISRMMTVSFPDGWKPKLQTLKRQKWKSGDLTWLPYHQIDHLDAVGEYFDALGISDISELMDGGRDVPDPNSIPHLGVDDASTLRLNFLLLPLDDSGLDKEEDIKDKVDAPYSPESTMSSTQQTPSTPTKPLEWLKRVNANRNTISSSDGITYSITPAELSACLDFDAVLRRPGAVLGNLHVPIAYPYLATRVNSDPLIGTMKMAIVDPDAGTIHVPMNPVDRSFFAPFVRGPNSESSIMKTLGLSNLSHKQQALYGKLLLDSAERGVGVSVSEKKGKKKKGKKNGQMNVDHGVKKQDSPMPAGPSTSSSPHPPFVFGSIPANNPAVQLGPNAAHNPLHVPNNTP